MSRQILFIQGAGNKSRPLGSGKLIAYLQKQLGSDYEVLAPDMPDPEHPRYLAWRNQIEHELGKLDADALLIGHSLGGSMLLMKKSRLLLFCAIKNNCLRQPSACSMGRTILSQKGYLCSLKTSSGRHPESS